MGHSFRLVAALILAAGLCGCGGRSQAGTPLTVANTIPLSDVKGRIDHLALDAAHHRLFIAEIANGTLDAVDLDAGRRAGRVSGLKEPQGVAFLPGRGELVVASGGDGTVRFYDGATLKPKAVIEGLDDADNVRVDPATGDIVVGYGSGGLAVIDPAQHMVKARIVLPSHPEGFQITADGKRAFVNLPRSFSIAVVDLPGRKIEASRPAKGALENFPMALDETDGVVLSGFRLPGRFVAFDDRSGKAVASLPACGPSDDLFYDRDRRRAYMLCADGHVDVFADSGGRWTRLDEVAAPRGGRTGLWDGKQLFVVSSGGGRATLTVLNPY
jgi:sugar lactone lactonase YvrE